MNSTNLQADPNPDWEQLRHPKVGDIVHLRDSRGLGRLYKGIVTSVSRGAMTARIDGVFGANGEGEILSGEGTEFRGKELSVDLSLIWKVIES